MDAVERAVGPVGDVLSQRVERLGLDRPARADRLGDALRVLHRVEQGEAAGADRALGRAGDLKSLFDQLRRSVLADPVEETDHRFPRKLRPRPPAELALLERGEGLARREQAARGALRRGRRIDPPDRGGEPAVVADRRLQRRQEGGQPVAEEQGDGAGEAGLAARLADGEDGGRLERPVQRRRLQLGPVLFEQPVEGLAEGGARLPAIAGGKGGEPRHHRSGRIAAVSELRQLRLQRALGLPPQRRQKRREQVETGDSRRLGGGPGRRPALHPAARGPGDEEPRGRKQGDVGAGDAPALRVDQLTDDADPLPHPGAGPRRGKANRHRRLSPDGGHRAAAPRN